MKFRSWLRRLRQKICKHKSRGEAASYCDGSLLVPICEICGKYLYPKQTK